MKYKFAIVAALTALLCVQVGAKDKQTYALSLQTFKTIETANRLVEEGDFPGAIEEVTERLGKRNSPFERAQLHFLLGSYYFQNNRPGEAIAEFALVLDSEGNMPEMLYKQALKVLIQLHMVNDQFDKARDYASRLQAADEIAADDLALIAQVYYKTSDWPAALDFATRALAMTDEAQQKPDENLLLLINATHFEMDAMANMLPVLERLIKHYPKPGYVLYMASIYGQLGEQDKQLVLMESLFENGDITEEAQLRNLASLYLAENVPYKSAVLMEAALKDGRIEGTKRNYQMLSQAWQLAAEPEHALLAIGEAAKLSDDGKLYLDKAYLHYSRGQWQNTVDALSMALDKGLEEEKEKGDAWLLLGMAQLNLKRFEQALEACQNASRFEESREMADSWYTYISGERDKYLAMGGVLP